MKTPIIENGWIGVDLDGTLALYDGWKGPTHIGEPIPAMLKKVKGWIQAGRDVRIFTARVSHDGTRERAKQAMYASYAIMEWCEKHLGVVLPITNAKDYGMTELWDDRAVQVIPNMGLALAEAYLMIPADSVKK